MWGLKVGETSFSCLNVKRSMVCFFERGNVLPVLPYKKSSGVSWCAEQLRRGISYVIKFFCEVSCSNSGVANDSRQLGCYTVSTSEELRTLRRIVVSFNRSGHLGKYEYSDLCSR